MKVTEFVANLQSVKTTATGYLARCPAHSDRRPSLAVAEADGRILIHCHAGCRTRDVLASIGLDYPDLFLDQGEPKGSTRCADPRQPERLPIFYWDWRSQCAELERLIQAKREHAEAMLATTHGLEVDALTPTEFDEVMDYVGMAYSWRACCERLDDTLFLVQQTLRADEQTERRKARKVKA